MELKAKGFDWILCTITLIVTALSYWLTVDILNTAAEEPASNYIAFMRGAFVFLAPCALEGMSFWSSYATKHVIVDSVEGIVGVLSVILGIYLCVVVLFAPSSISANTITFVKYALCLYPIKIVVNFCDALIQVIAFCGGQWPLVR